LALDFAVSCQNARIKAMNLATVKAVGISRKSLACSMARSARQFGFTSPMDLLKNWPKPFMETPGNLLKDRRARMIVPACICAVALLAKLSIAFGLTFPADMDPSFRAADLLGGTIRAISVQPDGKVLVAGNLELALPGGSSMATVARFHEDGRLDETFFPREVSWEAISSVIVQPDGKVLICGSSVRRLQSDGTEDGSFQPFAIEPPGFAGPQMIALTESHKIMVGGQALQRLHPDGSLDLEFTTPADFFRINAIAVQPDGKVIAMGLKQIFPGALGWGAWRFHPNGDLDIPMGPGGHALAIQPDGKILSGYTEVRRLNPDGARDEEFIQTDLRGTIDEVRAMVLQADGKIVFGGQFGPVQGRDRSFVARLEPGGQLDLGFDSVGGINHNPLVEGTPILVYALALDQKERILVGGNFHRFGGTPVPPLIRLNGGEAAANPLIFAQGPKDQRLPMGANAVFSAVAEGTPTPGYQWYHEGAPVPGATQPALTIKGVQTSHAGVYTLVASNKFQSIQASATLDVAVFTHPGSLDMDFRPCSGEICPSLIGALRDGRLVVQSARSSLQLLNPDGSFLRKLPLEEAIRDLNSVVAARFFEEEDGSMVVLAKVTLPVNHPAGYIIYSLSRFRPDGDLDPAFSPVILPANDLIMAVGPDRNIYMAGAVYRGPDWEPIVYRIGPEGLDAHILVRFSSGHSRLSGLAVDRENRVLVHGQNLWREGLPATVTLLRVDSKGEIDPSFSHLPSGVGAFGMHLLEDGKILVTGNLTIPGVPEGSAIARLHPNGSVDFTFQPPRVDGQLWTMAVQQNGKILLGGFFGAVNSVQRNHLARLNADGTLDSGFAPYGGSSSRIERMAIQNEQYVVVEGAPSIILNGVPWLGMGRLFLHDMEPHQEWKTPKLQQLRHESGSLTFSVKTVSSWRYWIEVCDDLGKQDWQVLSSVTGDGFLRKIEIPVTTSSPIWVRVRAGVQE
jgi:uncharacterized delta-60 repeat protein